MRKLWSAIIRLLLVLAMVVLLANAVVVGLHYQALAIVSLLGLTYRLTRRRWQVSGTYGTARESGLPDMMPYLGDRGLIMGRVGHAGRPTRMQALGGLLSPRVSSEWAVRQFSAAFLRSGRPDAFIRIHDYVHLATFSPAGGGKTVSVIAPNLLSHEGNCVVIDPKGELYALTHEHRQREFGHTIVRLDPARLFGPGDGFNPLDFLDPRQPEFLGACRDMANMLVTRSGMESEPHWAESAENIICTFIAYIRAMEGNRAARTMRGVRTQIASRTLYAQGLERMQSQQELFYGVLEDLGHSLTWHVERELGSVMSYTQRFTHIFGEPLVAAATAATSFDPMRLRTGRMTVYIIIPPDRLVVWQGLLRLWLGCLLRIITRGVPTEKNPVLFLVDECAHIGRMQALEDAITLLRGSGIRMWLFFQSIEQLKKCFGENAGTVLDNLSTQQYFSINSYPTAKEMSERIGDATVIVRSEGDNQGTSAPTGGDGRTPGNRNSGSNTNYSEAALRLWRPEQILVAAATTAFIFHKNNYVIVCDRIRYYADKAFRLRGIVRKRWGTGRTRGLGLSGLVLGLAALALAVAVTLFVASLSLPRRMPGVPVWRYPAYAAGEYDGDAADGPEGFDDDVHPLPRPVRGMRRR
jgi:type IV secretion system protein VirD4